MKEIKIELSKGKILLVLLGGISLVAVAFWLWNYSEIQQKVDPLLVKIIAVIGMLFFSICSFFGTIKLFDTKPGMIVNSRGFVNNSLVLDGQFVEWTHVHSFQIIEIKQTKILLVFIDNPEEIIDKSNIWNKFWLRQNLKWYGTPINVTSNTLKCNFEEMLNIMNEYANVKIKKV